jgi:hypothetical protein
MAVCFSNVSKSVVSAKHIRTFYVTMKYNVIASIFFLSASHRRKLLLVGDKLSTKVSLFTAEGEHAATVDLPFSDQLSDAAWIPIKDNIVYTNALGTNACVMSVTGDLIARTRNYLPTTKPSYISVSSDDISYIALGYNGIILSTDDGVTWTRLQPSPNGTPAYAIKVSTANHTADELWVLENQLTSFNYRLRTYKIDLQSGDILVNSSRDFAQFHSAASENDIFKLVYDGNKNVYVWSISSAKSVSVMSVNGDYVCRTFLYLDTVRAIPIQSLAVNKQRDYLYLGMLQGYVGVYSLSYNS